MVSHPNLEIVDVGSNQSFKVWAHGYPFRTVRWHFHPEYEIHLVTATHGRAFVGDYIGAFAPGDLTMTGPNVPHNWLSDLKPGETVAERGLVLQFSSEFLEDCLGTFPELEPVRALLELSARGVAFPAVVAGEAEAMLRRLMEVTGPARLALFFELLDLLSRCDKRRPLASLGYRADPARFMENPMNHVLDHIARNLGGELRESELAGLSGCSPSTFSRHFQKLTGCNFINYVTSMRINHACEMLARENRRITDVCFEVGFNNVSNFNRQFRAIKSMSPREYRALSRENAKSGSIN